MNGTDINYFSRTLRVAQVIHEVLCQKKVPLRLMWITKSKSTSVTSQKIRVLFRASLWRVHHVFRSNVCSWRIIFPTSAVQPV